MISRSVSATALGRMAISNADAVGAALMSQVDAGSRSRDQRLHLDAVLANRCLNPARPPAACLASAGT